MYWNSEIESLAIVENAENKLNEVQGKFRVLIKNKLSYVLGKNVGFFQKIKNIRDILQNTNENSSNDIEITPSDILCNMNMPH